MGQKLPPIRGTGPTPAPGSYDPSPERVMKSGPSFSMKSKLQSDKLRGFNGTPGPGSYESNLKDRIKGGNQGFGTSKRSNEALAKYTGGPGPGSYKINYTVGDVPNYALPGRSDQYKYV